MSWTLNPIPTSLCHVITVYKGFPNSTVSTSMNSTSTNFSAMGVKYALVEFIINKFLLVEFSPLNLYEFHILRFFSRSKKSY